MRIEHKNIPYRGDRFNPGSMKGFNQSNQSINPGSINLFITMCDYDEEKYNDGNNEREIRPNFQFGLSSGNPA